MSALDQKDTAFSGDIAADIRLERLRQVLRRMHEICTDGHIDCVAFMGDYTSYGKSEYIAPALEIMDSLLRRKDGTRPPVVGVPGNHDVGKNAAASLGRKGKFVHLAEQFERFGWTKLPIDECVPLAISGSQSTAVNILAINSSIGSWSVHNLPKELQDHFSGDKLSDAPLTVLDEFGSELITVKPNGQFETPKDRHDQLFTQLDTPYVSKNSFETLNSQINRVDSRSVVLVAHHNILPQRVPRVLAYGEMLNSGAFRDFLHASNKNIIYLHGHIHEDPVECVMSPRGKFSDSEPSQIISISAPRIIDGFNEVALFSDDNGEIFLVRVTKYRPDSLNMIGNFSDQETLHIPLISNFYDLITGVGRKIWQIIKDEGRMNWGELKEKVNAQAEVSDEVIEHTVLKLFCCRLVRVSQMGRPPKKWVVEAVEPKNG